MTKSIRALVMAFGMLALGMAVYAASRAESRPAHETRTISMYHVHTHESITITYWKDGRFIPSALNKLNHFLRDWRKNRVIRIDPKVIDLIYKMHEDLGSKKPVQIICGYRSSATNAMLRRIGRHVARRSRHITGQAIDFRFPDISVARARNLALAYGLGGVGYYGRTGFVHVDSGSVRQWPRLPATRLASIKRKYAALIGARYRRAGRTIMVASAKRQNFGKKPVIRASGKSVRMASATGPVSLVKMPAAKKTMRLAALAPVPRPRPYNVLLQAAANMQIAPASAPATVTNFAGRSGAPHDQIGMIIANTSMDDPTLIETPAASGKTARRYPRVNRTGKGDLAADIRNGEAKGLPLIKPLQAVRASAAPRDGRDKGWLTRLYASVEGMIRSNGAPQPLSAPDTPLAETPAADPRLTAASESQLSRRIAASRAHAASMLPLPAYHGAVRAAQQVNRSGKGDLLSHRPLALARRDAALKTGLSALEDARPVSFK